MSDIFADLHVDARELTPDLKAAVGRIIAGHKASAIRAAGAVDVALAAAGYGPRTIRPLRQLAALWVLTGGDRPAKDRDGHLEIVREAGAIWKGARL